MAEMRACPDCAEEVLAEAKVCKHCGHKFGNYTADGKRKVPAWVAILVIVAAVAVGAVLAMQSLNRSEDHGKRDADDYMCREIDPSYC